MQVRLLAVNDFHGHLEPPTGPNGMIGDTEAGGVEYLATHLRRLRGGNPNTVLVSAGDLIGGSPLLSALFHDEPTVESFDLMELAFNAVGNHEFDEGIEELLRMQEGGCHPVDGCLDGDGFTGARFRFLAANVERLETGRTVFPAYGIRVFDGVPIAFVGLTLEGTAATVLPSGIAGLRFKDEADTVNALIPELKGMGIEAVVVLVHEGGLPGGGHDECPGLSGPIVDIVERLDDEVDVVVSGHTHQAYSCVIRNGSGRGVAVTSAAAYGRLVTKIDLRLDRATGEVTAVQAANRIVTRDVARDREQAQLVARYGAIVAPLAERTTGSITEDITRAKNAAGESGLGRLVADAQLAATASPASGNSQVSFMNSGGLRADLSFAGSPGGEGDGVVAYREAFAVHPFGNHLVVMTLTGVQIDTLLEQQFAGCGTQTAQRILQVSRSLSYAWSRKAPPCSKVDPATIRLDGVPVDLAAQYRVTVNSFLAAGGDHFAVLKDGTDRLGGAVDIDVLVQYLQANSPSAADRRPRITLVE